MLNQRIPDHHDKITKPSQKGTTRSHVLLERQITSQALLESRDVNAWWVRPTEPIESVGASFKRTTLSRNYGTPLSSGGVIARRPKMPSIGLSLFAVTVAKLLCKWKIVLASSEIYFFNLSTFKTWPSMLFRGWGELELLTSSVASWEYWFGVEGEDSDAVCSNVVTFTNLIKGLFAQEKSSEAKKLLIKLVTKKQIDPNAATYGTVINGLYKSGNSKIAIELLSIMETFNFEADVYCYNMIIDSLCKVRIVSHAMNLLVELTENGISPNVVTYNSLIQGQMEEARKIFNSMVNGGLLPDIISYSTLINRYCKKRRIAEAMHLFKEASHKGLNHDTVIYNNMLHGLLENGKFTLAEELFNEMLAEGRSPDVVTYNIMLDCICKNRQFAEAFSFFHSMQKSELYISIVCYNILIDAACKDGKLEIAKELVNELFSNGLQPNERTYNAIINGLCQEGSLDEAKELLTRMEDNGCFPSDITYNIIVRGFLKRNQIYEAMVLLEKMLESGFSATNSTIEMLVECLHHLKQFMQTESYRGSLRLHLGLHRVILLQALLQAEDLPSALIPTAAESNDEPAAATTNTDPRLEAVIKRMVDNVRKDITKKQEREVYISSRTKLLNHRNQMSPNNNLKN
ncbi:hypothetical protein LguiA_030528 [Lonicera macranthoides]